MWQTLSLLALTVVRMAVLPASEQPANITASPWVLAFLRVMRMNTWYELASRVSRRTKTHTAKKDKGKQKSRHDTKLRSYRRSQHEHRRLWTFIRHGDPDERRGGSRLMNRDSERRAGYVRSASACFSENWDKRL